jgi:hypothetical protein
MPHAAIQCVRFGFFKSLMIEAGFDVEEGFLGA